MVRCQRSIHGWMPLSCDLGIFCSEIVEAWQHLRIGTVWAPTVALGAVGDNSLIIVAFGTAPPDFFIAGGSNLLRSERAIFRWVPFFGDGWKPTCQIVFARDDLFAGTNWTTAAVDTSRNGCTPFVTFVADPPNFAPGAGDDIARRQLAIFGWVPLASELGIIGGEIVLSAQECAIAANRTTSSSHAALNLSTPFVPMFTLPPNQTVAAGEHISWGKIAIPCRVPFGCKIRIPGCQISFSRDRPATTAIWTSCAAAAPGMDSRLPAVSIRTAPPNTPFAAVTHRFRSKR